MSIPCALAEALHHSSGPSKYDKRVVEVAQHGTLRGQTTTTRAREAAGTQYFTFDDEEVPAAEKKPGDVWPQERVLQCSLIHVDAPSIDVPAVQMEKEVDNEFQVALLVVQQQAIVQRWTMNSRSPCSSCTSRRSFRKFQKFHYPLRVCAARCPRMSSRLSMFQCCRSRRKTKRTSRCSSLCRCCPTSRELPKNRLLNSSELRNVTNECSNKLFDMMCLGFIVSFLKNECSNVRMSKLVPQARLVGVPAPHFLENAANFAPQERVLQRGEQVVDVHVPHSAVYVLTVEKVMDAAPRAASSSLDAPQEQIDVFLRTFLRNKKCEVQAAVECGTRRVLELINEACRSSRGSGF